MPHHMDVTDAEVQTAYAQLKLSGTTPTPLAIQKVLKKGSPTSIHKAIERLNITSQLHSTERRDLKAQEDDCAIARSGIDPNVLKPLLRNLQRDLQDDTEARIQSIKSKYKQEKLNVDVSLRKSWEKVDLAQGRILEIEKALESCKEKLAIKATEAENYKLAFSSGQTRLDAMERELNQLKADKESLQRSLDRSQDIHQEFVQRLNEDFNQLTDKANHYHHRCEHQEEKLHQYESDNGKLLMELRRANDTVAEQQRQLDALEQQRHSDDQTQINVMMDQFKAMQEQLSALKS